MLIEYTDSKEGRLNRTSFYHKRLLHTTQEILEGCVKGKIYRGKPMLTYTNQITQGTSYHSYLELK